MHDNVKETLQRYYFRRFHRFAVYIYFTLKNYNTQTVESVCPLWKAIGYFTGTTHSAVYNILQVLSKCEPAILKSKLHCSASNYWCQWSMSLKDKWLHIRIHFDGQWVNPPRLHLQSAEDSFTGKFRAHTDFIFMKVHLCHQRDLDDQLH